MKVFECTTCYRSLPLNQLPKSPGGLDCTHEPSTCRRCWRQWLKLKVQTVAIDQITCPECEIVLQQSTVKAIATTAVYNQYLDAEFRANLATDPEFTWCLSPGCKSGQIHTEGEIFRCISCGFKACVQCNAAWHEEETCGAFQTRRNQTEQEIESAKAVEKISKACPECDRKLEKNGGCDHMTCKCGAEFCWLCLVSYREIRLQGNSAHKRNCLHWRSDPGHATSQAVPYFNFFREPIRMADESDSEVE